MNGNNTAGSSSIDPAEVASASNINTDGTATYSRTASTRALSTPYTNGGDPNYYSDSYEEILDESSRKYALGLDSGQQELNSSSMQLSQRHCQHHFKHNQLLNKSMQPNDNDDDEDSYLNAAVDNCCSTNYATLNLDDEEIQKYFVNISSNFSRTSSIRRSVRNFSSSSKSNSNTNAANTPTHSARFGSVSARRSLRAMTTAVSTTVVPPFSGSQPPRASPFFFDQFSNTVACLKPSIPTYYSDASSCSSKASTLSRNRSNTCSYGSDSGTDQQGNFDPVRLRKALTSTIDNVAYYHAGQGRGSADKQGNAPPNSAGYETPSSIRWNFLGDIKNEEAEAAATVAARNRRRRSEQRGPLTGPSSLTPATRSYEEYWQMRKSTQNVNTVSIWCAENDERNAIMFHHESGVVENCSGNDILNMISKPATSGSGGTTSKAKSSEVLNNTIEGPARLSGSLQNMQRNVFSQSSSNIYNISSDFKVFEKQSNLYRNSINLSQNYLSSITSSQSSLNAFTSLNNPNLLNLNKVMNTSHSNRNRARQRDGESQEAVGNNMTLNMTALQFEKPSHLINLTAQNQLYRSTVNEGQGTSAEMETSTFEDAYFSITSASTEIINPTESERIQRRPWLRRLHDPIGMRDVLRIVRDRAKKFVKGEKKQSNC